MNSSEDNRRKVIGNVTLCIKVKSKINEKYGTIFTSKTIDNNKFDFVSSDNRIVGFGFPFYSEKSIPFLLQKLVILEKVNVDGKFLILGGNFSICEKLRFRLNC